MPSLLLGQTLCDKLGHQFAATFRYQFVLSNEARDLPPFQVQHCGSRFLYHCPELPVYTVFDATGRRLAILLGYAVDKDGRLITEDQTLHFADGVTDPSCELETWRKYLNGRHVVLTFDPVSGELSRAYIDTIGSLGIVFDPSTGMIATSLLLCLTRDIVPNPDFGIADGVYACRGLRPFLPPPHPDQPAGGHNFGQTPDKNVRRVLPNHYLCLPSCETVRWRSSADLDSDLEVPEAADRLVSRLRQVMRAYMTGAEGYLALSGGLDSRMLLACAPPPSEARASLYTYANNFASSLDARIAEELAEDVGYPIQTQIPSDGIRGSFFWRRRRSLRMTQRAALSSGLLTAGDPWWQRGYAHALPSGGLWMRGNFLEIVTARMWPRRPLEKFDTLDHIMLRALVGIGDEKDHLKKREMTAAWRDSIGDDTGRNLHDFAYQELGVGHSQPGFLALNQQFYLAPASDYQVLDLASRVDGRQRRTSKLGYEILSLACPSLAKYPYARTLMWQRKRTDQNARELLESELAGLQKTLR